jgi:hypothetical protein
MRSSERGYIGLLMLLLGTALIAWFYFGRLPGQGEKPVMQQQIDDVQLARDAQNIANMQNAALQKAANGY